MHDDLISRYIVQDKDRPGPANARIREYNVPVWAIIGYLEAVGWNASKVAEDYEVSTEAVLAALGYYEQHHDPIRARIESNAAV